MRQKYQATTIQAGFALIEVLVAVIILAGGLLTLAKLNVAYLENSSHAGQRTEATMIGQRKIEQFRSFEALNTTTGKFAYVDITSGTETVTGVNATYTLSWEVDENTAPDFKTIVVTVTWADNRDATQTASFTSRIARADPALSGKLI